MFPIPTPHEIRKIFSVPGRFEAATCRGRNRGIEVFGVLNTAGRPENLGITVCHPEQAHDAPFVTDDFAMAWSPARREASSDMELQKDVRMLLPEVAERIKDAAWLRYLVDAPTNAVASWSFTPAGLPCVLTDEMIAATQGPSDLDIRVQLHSNCVQKCLFCPVTSPAYSEQDQAGDLSFITELARRVVVPARRNGLFTTFRLDSDDLSSHRYLRSIMEVVYESAGCPLHFVVPANRLASSAVAGAFARLPGLVGLSTTILGATAATHDLVAGRPGAFAETVRALKNISSLPLQVQGHMVLTSDACGEIGPTAAIIAHFGIDVLIQCLIADCWRHEVVLPRVTPDLETVRHGMEKACEQLLDASATVNVRLSDFPVCAIPSALRHLACDEHPRESLFKYRLPDECGACVHRESCIGLSSVYLDRFGASGIRPEARHTSGR